MCWGYDGQGAVGDGIALPVLDAGLVPNAYPSVSSDSPANVVGLSSDVAHIATWSLGADGGQWACALTADGGVQCWGDNHSGQLGTTPLSESSVPIDVPGLATGVDALGPGCAVTSAGAVWCWGAGLDGGAVVPPVLVQGLDAGVAVLSTNATLRNGCARMTTGGIRCWGSNSNGQLGNGTTTASAVAVDVVGF
jgi:hypothetical protein